jgi:NAD(P)-dependent dehydrogenase (short-subunit alcohol dehydrogenase family)
MLAVSHVLEAFMTLHPAFAPGRVAVITGAASGIGLATAQRCAALGMKLCLADIDAAALAAARDSIASHSAHPADIIAVVTDVSRREQVEALADAAQSQLGDVAFLMNNAGTEGGGALLGDPARWAQILGVNLMGVVNGIQVFTPGMIAQSRASGLPAAIVNTGSKQGITCPPGDTAYNVSKAGIKVVSEALAHELRQHAELPISAHLLIPGFTFTGFTRATTKPAAAWLPEQVVDFMFERMAAGDFYILCPDNDVNRKTDELRIRWAAEDIIHNRPPLSRWHKDYGAAFAEYLKANGA